MASGVVADWTIREVREWAQENAIKPGICAALLRKRTCGMELLRLQSSKVRDIHLPHLSNHQFLRHCHVFLHFAILILDVQRVTFS